MKKELNHCSCCGRFLKHPKTASYHRGNKEIFCKKCGIVHLANMMSDEPNEIYREAKADTIRQEAIKWVKDCKERTKLGLPNLTQEQFIIKFFNITDDQLNEQEV